MIVPWASTHGSPGTTSWTVLAGAAWPSTFGVERVLLEADLDGGVLGARYGLGVDPGVVSLIAALRRSTGEPVPVADHGRLGAPGLWLVPGPESGEQARSVWAGTAATVAERLAEDARVWLVDVGRLHGGSLTVPLVERARLTMLVCGARAEDLVQVPARVASLAAGCARVAVLVVGRTAYSSAELGEFFGTSMVWRVGAHADVATIAGVVLSPGRARRSLLWRTALDVTAEIARLVHDDDVDAPETHSDRPVDEAVGR
jgi:hypothetical protein